MDRADLNAHIRTLATLRETDAPVVSCYLGVARSRPARLSAFEERVRSLKKTMRSRERRDFENALEPIRSFISAPLLPDSRGAAIFSRAGGQRFFLPLQFQVPLPDVVEASINAFVAQEERESQAAAEKLVHQLRSGGLATAGTQSCLEALRHGRADVLVLAADYSPQPLRTCKVCHLLQEEVSRSLACLGCGCEEWREFDPKEELVRFAETTGCGVEVVNQSDALTRLGGVGCLLRFGVVADVSPSPELRRVSQ
jgi:hypothetical protein